MNKAVELAVHVISQAIANEPAIAADITKLIDDLSTPAPVQIKVLPRPEAAPAPAATSAPAPATTSTPAPEASPAPQVFTGQAVDPALA
jgi:hypothetical protein